MVTATGKAPGAASPRASNARAISPATISGLFGSSLVLSLGAKLDELDSRRAAARALPRQHRGNDFEVAGQTLPGRRRVGGTGAQRARLVGHLFRDTSLPVSDAVAAARRTRPRRGSRLFARHRRPTRGALRSG